MDGATQLLRGGAFWRRYDRLIGARKQVWKWIEDTLTPADIMAAGERLGVPRVRNKLRLRSQAAVGVILEHAIFWTTGENVRAVDKVRTRPPTAPSAIESEMLTGLADSRFALIEITAAKSGGWLIARDYLHDDKLLLADREVSHSLRVGAFAAGRLAVFPGFCLVVNALGLIPPPLMERVLTHLENFDIQRFYAKAPRGGAPFDTLAEIMISREFLRYVEEVEEREFQFDDDFDADDDFELDDDPDVEDVPYETLRFPIGAAALPNLPCPCGSGRKFKNCCGAR